MRQANPAYMGDDPSTPGNSSMTPTRSIDLLPTTIGVSTFQNPCFWLLIGIIGTIAVQWLLMQQRGKGG